MSRYLSIMYIGSENRCTHRPSLLPIEWLSEALGLAYYCRQRLVICREVGQTWSFRGSKSRNKVSVGEPADGSLTHTYTSFSRKRKIVFLSFTF